MKNGHQIALVAVFLRYVTVKCGNSPKVAFSNASGDKMRLASSIQRQPR